jgi:anti-sigma factor (TIGR02949 family)
LITEMTCEELEPLLHPFIDGELVASDRAELETHLISCDACAKKASQERLAIDVIRSRARAEQPKAPEALKLKLLNSIHQETSLQRRRAAYRWAAAAAAAGIALVAGQREYRAIQCRLLVEDAAGIHTRQYPLDVKAKANELETMLSGQLGYNVHVPSIPNAVATGARFIHVRGKDAVLIRYQLNGHSQPLSLIVSDDEPSRVTEPEYDTSRGYNAVTWHDGNVGYHLLTDLDEQDIRQLVPAPRGTQLPTLDARPAALAR